MQRKRPHAHPVREALRRLRARENGVRNVARLEEECAGAAEVDEARDADPEDDKEGAVTEGALAYLH